MKLIPEDGAYPTTPEPKQQYPTIILYAYRDIQPTMAQAPNPLRTLQSHRKSQSSHFFSFLARVQTSKSYTHQQHEKSHQIIEAGLHQSDTDEGIPFLPSMNSGETPEEP
ncbi:hypothetical protein [Endozoicomonas sp. Mp262]|uniref:hypothetical protein n=1 Tax=Endozoicomonas sp. Mp262 TaxID=2919499 RepID=UPI0021D858AC